VAFYAQQAPTSVGTLRDGYTPPRQSRGHIGRLSRRHGVLRSAGVAAMEGGHDALASLVYRTLVSNSTVASQMGISGVFTYFHASWGVLSLLALSGNF